MKITRYVILFLGLLLATTSAASTPLSAPAQVILDVSDEIRLALEHSAHLKTHPEALNSVVNRVFMPRIDFHRFAKLMLGKAWREADSEQQVRFVAAFKGMLTAMYSGALLRQKDWVLTFKSTKFKNPRQVVVRTTVGPARGFQANVYYRMHKQQDQWQIYDVMVEGVSLVTTYRYVYAKVVKKQGLEGLISNLTESDTKQRTTQNI